MKNRFDVKSGSKKMNDELSALARMRDEEINLKDIPETTDWSKAVVGKFYRPPKEAISLRLDTDLLAWLKKGGPGYQSRINVILRSAMTSASANDAREHSGLRPGCSTHPTRCRAMHFPALERHGALQGCTRIAGAISERHSVFPVAR